MYILAFDTSSNSLSIALSKDNKTLSKETISPSSNQSGLLITKIEDILEKNNITYQALNLIATTNGPGSFTGSRIGLTAARTIKLATKLPLILLDSCQIIAFKHQRELQSHQELLVTLDARSDEIFYAAYKSIAEIKSTTITPQITTLHNIQDLAPRNNFFLCGSATSIVAPLLQSSSFQNSKENDIIEADIIAHMAFEMQNRQSTNLNPIYLRSPRITKRKK